MDGLNGQGAFHEQTARHVGQFISQPSHALLLLGPAGGGKQFIAELTARQLVGAASAEELYKRPYFKQVLPEKDKTAIGIEAVRDLQQFTKLKLPDTAKDRRIILITDAHNLTAEAQNALLKLLEEPPASTVFILTASSSQSLLPTIRSRTQHITVHQPPQASLIAHFEGSGYDGKAVQQAYLMSGGLPGLMHALLQDEDHPLKTSVQTARKLLQAGQFERLCMVDELAKKKPETLQVLFVLQHMARAAIAQAAKVTDGSAEKRIRQWHRIMQAAHNAEQSYAVSGQAKLTLTNLMLSL